METASAAPSVASQAPSTPATSATESKGTVGTPSTTAPKTAAERYELKVNGKTTSLSREELIAKAQLGMSADERFALAAQKAREVEGVMGSLKDPKMAIKNLLKLGLNKDQVREAMEQWYTEEFIEPEQLTPEQRKYKEAERELKTYKEKEAAALKEQQDKEFEALTTKEREHMQTSITEALDKSGLPRSKFMVSRIAFYMHKNLTNGWDAPMDVIVEQVKKERMDMVSDLINNSDMDSLESYFGPELFKKLRKHDLTKLRQRKMGGVSPENQVNAGSVSKRDDDDNGGKISYREVERRRRLLMQGKSVT